MRALILVGFLVACGKKDTSDDVEPTLGGPCGDNTICHGGEYCFVERGADTDVADNGICMAIPASCGDDVCAPCEEIKAQCSEGGDTAIGTSCFQFGTAIQFECI
jgi:hypothetical protein